MRLCVGRGDALDNVKKKLLLMCRFLLVTNIQVYCSKAGPKFDGCLSLCSVRTFHAVHRALVQNSWIQEIDCSIVHLYIFKLLSPWYMRKTCKF